MNGNTRRYTDRIPERILVYPFLEIIYHTEGRDEEPIIEEK
jgi:hypothetical protein